MKRIKFLLTLVLAMMTATSAWADGSGECGDGLTWSLTGTELTISYSGTGTGAMTDYIWGSVTAPWGTDITKATIGEGVTSIGNYAFLRCTKLTTVTIPKGVTNIGDNAFRICTSLTDITFPGSMTTIGEYAFNECTALTDITIPGSMTTIGSYAFGNCTALTDITIPKSVTSIGSNPFAGCPGLTAITVEAGNEKYDSRDNCNAIIETASNKLIAGCPKTVIPSSVTSIGYYAFNGCTVLTAITIPESVTSIGENAFSDCTGLTTVTIPENVKSIGYSAFSDCTGLTAITIPSSVTTIGGDAFSDCTGLTTVTVKAEKAALGSDAFKSWDSQAWKYYILPNLTTIYVPASALSYYQTADNWKDYFDLMQGFVFYDLTTGASEHGSVSFTVDGTEAVKAKAGDVVTAHVFASKGYKSSGLTARAYMEWGAAKAPSRAAANLNVLDFLTVTPVTGVDSCYTFTMPDHSVAVYPDYGPRPLSLDMIAEIEDQALPTGANPNVEPTLVVMDRCFPMTLGTDYTVSYKDNTAVGTATATITAAEGSLFTGSASRTFRIARELEKWCSTYSTSIYNYTGEEIIPDPVVRAGNIVLVRDKDYTVEAKNNINVPATSSSPQPTYIVKGIGEYMGEVSGQFTIIGRPINDPEVTIEAIEGLEYDGTAQEPKLTLKYKNNTLRPGSSEPGASTEGVDYFTTYSNSTTPGKASVKVEGVNNFTGDSTFYFNIAAKALTADMIADVADLTYTGEAQTPAPKVSFTNGANQEVVLSAGTDFQFSYKDNTAVGTATLTISALNDNYQGTASKTFSITKADITLTDPTNFTTALVYTGKAQTLVNAASVDGKDKAQSGTVMYTLTPNDEKSWSSEVCTGTDAGTYTVYYKVVGNKNHNDVAQQSITATIEKAVITTAAFQGEYTYNKKEQTAVVKEVKAGDIALTADDYVIVDDANKQTAAGTYTVKFKAAASSNFKDNADPGYVTAQFTIVQADAKVFSMTLDPTTFVYNAEGQKPAVTVKDGDAKLTAGTDYDLSFENNVNAGTAKVTATGKGNYQLTKEATYTIVKANATIDTHPTAITLTYNREAQTLVTAATATGIDGAESGKVMYSTDGENFSESLPKMTEAGSYTVSYFVAGNSNHNNSDTTTVACAIQKDQATMSYATAAKTVTYGDSNFTNALTQGAVNNTASDNVVNYTSSDARVAKVQYYTGEVTIVGAGTCTITAIMQEHGNFKKQADNVTYTITVEARAITADNVTLSEAGDSGVPEITVSVEAPVGTLTPVEDTDYTLTFYNKAANATDRQSVTPEQMAATPGEYIAVLSFFGNYSGYVEKTITVKEDKAPVIGDVNNDGVLDNDDVLAFLDDLLDNNVPTDPTSPDFVRYDANNDGRIDIADAQAILNLSIGLNFNGSEKTARTRHQDEAEPDMIVVSMAQTQLGSGISQYVVSFEGGAKFTGLQMDITGSEVISISTASSAPSFASVLQNGAHRLIVMPDGTEMTADGAVVTIIAKGAIALSNVAVTNAHAQSLTIAGETTGIGAISADSSRTSRYNLIGQPVDASRQGVVILDGKKVFLK